MARRWKCSVCGYVHVGDEPPAICPVCGADRSQFTLLATEQPAGLQALIATFMLHPVVAHFPNGLIPTAAFFLVVGLALGHPGLDAAAFWLIMVATAVVPVSLGSGLHDWQKHFGGRRAPIFFKKIGLALALLTLGVTAIALRQGHPELMTAGGWQPWAYLACLLGMLGCVALLGHYGGMLVFQGAGEPAGTLLSGSKTDEWPRMIVAQAPDAILAADASGVIRLWNHGAERVFGTPAKEAIGQSLDLIIPEALRQRHWEGWAKALGTGASRYGQELLRVPALRHDGGRFSAEFSVVMLKDASGKIAGVAAILRDVSEQRERDQQLQEQLKACRERQGNQATT
jgi:PAS domain S-box-containing protein